MDVKMKNVLDVLGYENILESCPDIVLLLSAIDEENILSEEETEGLKNAEGDAIRTALEELSVHADTLENNGMTHSSDRNILTSLESESWNYDLDKLRSGNAALRKIEKELDEQLNSIELHSVVDDCEDLWTEITDELGKLCHNLQDLISLQHNEEDMFQCEELVIPSIKEGLMSFLVMIDKYADKISNESLIRRFKDSNSQGCSASDSSNDPNISSFLNPQQIAEMTSRLQRFYYTNSFQNLKIEDTFNCGGKCGVLFHLLPDKFRNLQENGFDMEGINNQWLNTFSISENMAHSHMKQNNVQFYKSYEQQRAETCLKLLQILQREKMLLTIFAGLETLRKESNNETPDIIHLIQTHFQQEASAVKSRVTALENRKMQMKEYLKNIARNNPLLHVLQDLPCKYMNVEEQCLQDAINLCQRNIQQVLMKEGSGLEESEKGFNEAQSNMEEIQAGVEKSVKKLHVMSYGFTSCTDALEDIKQQWNEIQTGTVKNPQKSSNRLLWLGKLLETDHTKHVEHSIDFGPCLTSTPK